MDVRLSVFCFLVLIVTANLENQAFPAKALINMGNI
jgi:hypothetical protein